MLKVVDGKLELFRLSHVLHFLFPSPCPEQDQGAGGLELWLKPVLSVGVGVGNIDAKATVLAENDQSRATL